MAINKAGLYSYSRSDRSLASLVNRVSVLHLSLASWEFDRN